MFEIKMLPGQAPYTEEEQRVLSQLLAASIKAEEIFSADELERFAAEQEVACG